MSERKREKDLLRGGPASMQWVSLCGWKLFHSIRMSQVAAVAACAHEGEKERERERERERECKWKTQPKEHRTKPNMHTGRQWEEKNFTSFLPEPSIVERERKRLERERERERESLLCTQLLLLLVPSTFSPGRVIVSRSWGDNMHRRWLGHFRYFHSTFSHYFTIQLS